MKKIIYLLFAVLVFVYSCELKDEETVVGPTDPTTPTDEPTIEVTSPKSGDSMMVASSFEIKWTSANLTTNVNIDYTADNAATWVTIKNNIANTGSYIWSPVPNAISNQCRVRVTATDSSAVDESEGFFKIIDALSSVVQLSKPNGGEVLFVGTDFRIEWASSGIDNIMLEFSTNSGTTWNFIVPSYPADSSYYLWAPVPNFPSTNCLIRVTDVSSVALSDVSNTEFTIGMANLIRVTSPNGGEIWNGSSSQTITWFSSEVENVKIEYTINNGLTWITIVENTLSDGFYTWDPIPNTPSTISKVRITNVDTGFPSDESDFVFAIAPESEITIVSPNGGENWLAGSSQYITWSTAASNQARPVKGGSQFHSKSSTRSDELVISTLLKNNNKNRNRGTQTSGPVKFNPEEVLSISDVKIEYSTNGGASWRIIVSSAPNNGAFPWDSIPSHNSALCRVRVSDADDGVPFDISDNNFLITNQITQSIDVTSPNGGEFWQAGTSQYITWNSSGVEVVKVEYTSNNGLEWNLIADNVVSSGSYDWSVPNINSTQMKVRVSDATDGIPSNESNSVFTVRQAGSLSLTKPISGEVWVSGQPNTIEWESENVENIKIEYTINDAIYDPHAVYFDDEWFVLVESVPSGPGSYEAIFTTASEEYRVRISDAEFESPADFSGLFTILPQPAHSTTVTSPNGGELWLSGSYHEITWTSENVTDVKIDYSINNGATWNQVTQLAASIGTYTWGPIPVDSSHLCKVRVSDATDENTFDVSDNPFTIAPSPGVEFIRVAVPDGGEVWQAGTSQNISWVSSSVSDVKIEYTINNGVSWTTIVASTPSDGFYTWFPVPNSTSTNCKVRISDAEDGYPFDLSDNTFTIAPEPGVEVVNPNGGENWQAGSSQNITWTSTNIGSVKLEYTTNNGASWELVVASTPSVGTYTWEEVPNVNSTLCRIKVSDADDGLPYDISDDNFVIYNQITQNLTVVSPNGGEIWDAGTTQNITWNSSGISFVKLEYTTNNGIDWVLIEDNVTSAGSYDWDLPNLNSTQCKVRISDSDDDIPSDESNSTFIIKPVATISVTKPESGEVWISGESNTIEWQSENVENVMIEYTINNGILPDDWFILVASTPAGDGVYETIFTIASDEYRVRLSDAEFGFPVATSGLFTVSPAINQKLITVVSPNGGEDWLVGETYEINWTSTNVENVKLEYTTDGGFLWNLITASTPSDGLYEEFTPTSDDSSDVCKVKISDVSDESVLDVSDGFFSIHGGKTLRIIWPNGGEYLCPDDTPPYPAIIWESVDISFVRIELTVDNGFSWIVLEPIIQSTGAYGFIFTLQPYVSALSRIRITDVSPDAGPNPMTDQSDSYFFLNICEGIIINRPGEGQNQWNGSSDLPISWFASEDVGTVKLEYSLDDGSTWHLIADGVRNNFGVENKYNWHSPPDAVSINARIKISGGGYETVSEKFNLSK